MRRIYYRHNKQSALLNSIQQAATMYHDLIQPFSESDILSISDVLLTPGFHYMQVADILSGRNIISSFLYSLNYYNNIGYLATTDIQALPIKGSNIIYEMEEQGFLYESIFLDNYLATSFIHDFIWIEESKSLCSLSWYNEFCIKLKQYNFDQTIPIIVLSYQQQKEEIN